MEYRHNENCQSALVCIGQYVARILPYAGSQEEATACFLLGCGTPGEAADLIGVVEIVVPEGIAPGRMRADERSVDEERVVAVLFYPVRHGLAHKGGLGQLRREPSRGPGRAVVVGPREVGDRLVERMGIGRDVKPLGRQPGTPGRASLFRRSRMPTRKPGRTPS